MRVTLRDYATTMLVAAVAVPYVGYLVNGEMPFIKDPRGMAAVGLVLGTAAFLIMRTGDASDRVGKLETGMAIGSLLLGLAALAFAEAGAAETLLLVFMASILVVWAVELADHAGLVHAHAGPAAHA